METFIAIITLVVSVLQIILFFKIWVMTGDVSKMRELMEYSYNLKEHDSEQKRKLSEVQPNNNLGEIELYDWIKVIKTNEAMQVMEVIDNDTYLCVNPEHPDGMKLKRHNIEIIEEDDI